MASVSPSVVSLEPTARRWALLTGAVCLLPLLLQLPPTLGGVVAITAVAVTALAWRQPLPTWLRALLALAAIGLVLSVSGFHFGRDTGCALLAAMLAIKPSETYSLRDARSLVGFALFAPFATFLLDEGPLSLGLGLIAAVLALTALRRFAEIDSGDTAPPAPWRRLGQIGRLLAIGLPLALTVFWLFPRFASPLWGVPGRALARPGLSDRMAPGEWLDLLNDESVALRARFYGATPNRSQMYWRGPVLWDFDGRTWTQPRWRSDIPPAQARTGPVTWDYEIEIEPTDRRQLVALELPLEAPPGTQLTLDHGLFASRPLAALTRWRMRSAPPLDYQPQLPAQLREIALALPPGYNPRTQALARQWRAQAGSNDEAIVRRALGWIRAEFGYTLSTPPAGRHGVDEFLFDQKAGFCQHFSGSFVILMRGAGIPARVVTGYAGGYLNPMGGYWMVRRSDAHAWAEVWLRGRGWVRVDPTAAVAPERIYDTLADRAPGASGMLGGLAASTSLFNATDWLRRGWNDYMLGFNAERQQQMLRPLGIDRLDPARLVTLFAVAAMLALLWMLWLSNRGPREADPVLRAWHRLNARYARLGLARAPHETAGDWAERVSNARPDLAEALRILTKHFNDWRYADAQSGRRTAHDLIRALRSHRPRTTGERR
ncbi:MAG: transglutaminase TgpA family protein [Lysobacter sp.]